MTISTSNEIGALASALATAQGQFPNPKKNKKVKAKSYEFWYADLTSVMEAIKKPLADNDLAFVQAMSVDKEDGKFRLVTRLMHGETGQWIESVTPLFVGEGSSQAFGSALTFMKRYALCALLGIVADDDDDANTAEGNAVHIDTREYGSYRKPKAPATSPMVASGASPQAAPQEVPHAIPVVLSADHGGNDWPTWGRSFIDAARSSGSTGEQDAWLTANQDALRQMCNEAPKIFVRLEKATADIYKKILLEDANEQP